MAQCTAASASGDVNGGSKTKRKVAIITGITGQVTWSIVSIAYVTRWYIQIVHRKMKICHIYSLLCCSKRVWLSLFCENIFSHRFIRLKRRENKIVTSQWRCQSLASCLTLGRVNNDRLLWDSFILNIFKHTDCKARSPYFAFFGNHANHSFR